MRRGNRGLSGLALLATLALTIGVVAGSAASAAGDPVAGTAGLKKCLKKAKRIENPKKRKKAKKKCKKKFAPVAPVAPGAPGAPGALTRATLTWDSEPPGGGGNIDLDLWVFDSNGNQARAAANAIPNSAFSANDLDAPGTETFTDLVYTNPGGRNFSFGVCYQDGGSQHTIYNLDYVTADGVHHTASEEYGSDGASTTFNGGAPIPGSFCKAP
jgi:hypothetical protein